MQQTTNFTNIISKGSINTTFLTNYLHTILGNLATLFTISVASCVVGKVRILMQLRVITKKTSKLFSLLLCKVCDINSYSSGNALAQSILNSLPCTVRTSRRRSCYQVHCLLGYPLDTWKYYTTRYVQRDVTMTRPKESPLPREGIVGNSNEHNVYSYLPT